MGYKPYKIQLSTGDSKGMYLLANEDEIKLDKAGNTKAPNRSYKIQIEVEAIYKNKRCRGKKSFIIQKGTSMVKACLSMISKRINMLETLKEQGTLKAKKVVFENIDNDDKKFKTCFEKFIQNRKIATKKYGKPASDNTIRNYVAFYNKHLKVFDNKNIDTITANDIEKLRNKMIEAKLKPATMKPLKVIMKQILEEYDVFINWNKIVFPTPDNVRKYDRDIDETVKIVDLIYNYLPMGSTRKYEINAVFKLLLTGRRISECTELRYEYLDLKHMMIRYPKDITKTTESRYIQGNHIQSANALSTFKKAISQDIIDVEVIEDKSEALKNLFPNASNEQIKQAINILES
jgi:hypothetical protein